MIILWICAKICPWNVLGWHWINRVFRFGIFFWENQNLIEYLSFFKFGEKYLIDRIYMNFPCMFKSICSNIMAQLVNRRPVKRKVPGSDPTGLCQINCTKNVWTCSMLLVHDDVYTIIGHENYTFNPPRTILWTAPTHHVSALDDFTPSYEETIRCAVTSVRKRCTDDVTRYELYIYVI